MPPVDGRPVRAITTHHLAPKWVHGKRRVAELVRWLPAAKLVERVCAALDGDHGPQLTISQDAA